MKRNSVWVHQTRFLDIPFLYRGYVTHWVVEILAPGIGYFVVAGFPTWQEAMEYANKVANNNE